MARKYFLMGKCWMGKACRFEHPLMNSGNLNKSVGNPQNNKYNSLYC